MKVALFIDGKNFYSGWKDSGSASQRIDFTKLAEWLVKEVGGVHLAAAHYYTGVEDEVNQLPETYGKLNKFLTMIKAQRGYFVHSFRRKTHRMQCQHCNAEIKYTKEKEVDTSMVADMVRMAAVNAYDIAVLLSGDADYIPAINSVAQLGKQAWVASWNGSGLALRAVDAAFGHINLMDGLSYFQLDEDSVSRPSHVALNGKNGNHLHVAVSELKLNSIDEENTLDQEEEIFVQELSRAEAHFSRSREGTRNGYVGLGYFITKWRSDQMSNQPDGRRLILDRLTEIGRVEVYAAGDGFTAIRVNKEWDADVANDSDDEPFGDQIDQLG